jgi:hypothetical protein
MEFYWPSFYWSIFTFMLALLASTNGCAGVSAEECAAINNYCANGGCF